MSKTLVTLLGGALALASIGTVNFFTASATNAPAVAWDQPPYPTPGPGGPIVKGFESTAPELA